VVSHCNNKVVRNGEGGEGRDRIMGVSRAMGGERGRRERRRGRLVCTGVVIIYHSHEIRS
jgi:hypothetical protein